MDADPEFWTLSSHDLAQVMNGCGPDSWTDSMRGAASWVYRNFPEQIAIHDFDFNKSDGVVATLVKVNQRFWDNAKIKLDLLYPLTWGNWYGTPVRAWAWAKLRFAFFALKNGSEEAWIDAHNRLVKPVTR
jgi:hypothetical protein